MCSSERNNTIVQDSALLTKDSQQPLSTSTNVALKRVRLSYGKGSKNKSSVLIAPFYLSEDSLNTQQSPFVFLDLCEQRLEEIKQDHLAPSALM